MKRYIYISLFILFTVTLQGQVSKKVLFLGNSYTAYNNLPLLVNNMATSTGNVLTYDSNTPGGYRFLNHATNATTLNKINAENWDYVVLQGQSQETSFSQTQMQNEVYPHVATLCNNIRANNTCSKPLFYMTWGRENGDANNCGGLPWVCTYTGMDDVIRATYTDLANVNEAEVSPVGAVWRFLRENHPEIDLYSGDGSHPSLTGSYAAAVTFYTMIYKLDPTLITWNSSLSDATASTIKLATKTVVFDAITNWDFTNLANADFTLTNTNGAVTFSNTPNLDNYFWNFGDGITTTTSNPTHTYTANGDYTVSLTVTKCGETNTSTQIVTINNLSTIAFSLAPVITLYPIPTKNKLNISLKTLTESATIKIYDTAGKEVLQKEINVKDTIEINTASLKTGLYILQLITNDKIYTEKILKN